MQLVEINKVLNQFVFFRLQKVDIYRQSQNSHIEML